MLASLSLDLDNKWSYLRTHGDRGWEEFPSYLDVVVPRFLSLLSKLNLRITVFVVGQDAALEKNRAALASISAAGHEIGNHSFHHEPWLHLYSPAEIEAEIGQAEEAIADVTGSVPVGFRGPGYSLSPAVVQCLMRRGYRYDGSTLPTIIGPLARAYYFFHARLNSSQKRERKRLFGNWTDGFQPLNPYWWQTTSGNSSDRERLLEIPVTTMPLFRVPFHFSYLLFLYQKSSAAAWAYWRMAITMCQLCRVEPSLLLHPLDLLGGDEESALGFFPGMQMPTAAKAQFIEQLLADLAQRFDVLPMGEHAEKISERASLRVRELRGATDGGDAPKQHQQQQRLSMVPDAALPAEARTP